MKCSEIFTTIVGRNVVPHVTTDELKLLVCCNVHTCQTPTIYYSNSDLTFNRGYIPVVLGIADPTF